MTQTYEQLQRTFGGSIPSYYDTCLGPAWFDRFASELAHRLPRDPGGDVLELACGTGLMTRHLRERLDSSRRVIATDLSQPMLDYASRKLAHLGGIEWRQADASELPFEDEGFAAVVCSFGVMFVPDRDALFSEARRVLRRGGIFIFSVWDRIEENTCARVFAEWVEGMFPGDQELRFRVPYEMWREDLLLELLAKGSFKAQKVEKVSAQVEASARDVATGQVRGTPRGVLLAKRGLDLDDIIEKVTRALEEAAGAGAQFRANCQAIAVEAEAI